MSPLNRILGLPGLFVAFCVLGWSPLAEATPRPEQLLPASTREFYSSPSLKQLRLSLRETQFVKLLNDPALEKFSTDLLEQSAKGNEMNILGFTLTDLSLLDPGESALATVEVSPRQPGEVLLFDVSGKQKIVQELLAERSKRWREAGGRERSEPRKDAVLTIQEKPAQGNRPGELRVHCLKEDLLIASDTVSLMDAVLQLWDRAGENSLSEQPAFKSIQEQTRPQSAQQMQLRFFVDPFGLHDLVTTPTQKNQKKDPWEQLRRAGLNGIKAVGGFLAFNQGDHDFDYHVAVYAPRPYRKGMGIFKFLESEDFTPPAWVRPPFSSYLSISLDLSRGFDSLGALYDQFVVDGEVGTFQETLSDLRKDPKVHLDICSEIVGQLGNRVHLLTDTTRTTGKISDRFLAAIPVKNRKIVENAVYRFYNGDDRMRQVPFLDRYVLWEVAKHRKNSSGSVEEVVDIPYHVVTVSGKYFYMSSDREYLESILRRENARDDPSWLGKQEDYQRFRQEVAQLSGGKKTVSQQFTRLADDLGGAYELARSNRLEGAPSLYATLLHRFLQNNNLKIKGELLPEFSKISHHLSTAGNFIRNTPDGFEIVGFCFKKNQE